MAGVICYNYSIIGTIPIFCILAASVGALVTTPVKKMALILSIIILYLAVKFIQNPTPSALYNFFLQNSLFILAFILSITTLNEQYQIKLLQSFSFIFCIFFVVCIVVEVSASDINQIVLYKSLFGMSFFFLCKQKKLLLYGILYAVFCLLIGERAASLTLIFVFVFYYLLKTISKRRFQMIFIATFVLCVLFPFVYVRLWETELGILLNELSWKYTNSNFFSGRQNIWNAIIEAMHNHWLFGLGIDSGIELKYYGGILSTHNLYMFLYLEGGVFLIGLFFCFLYLLWNKLYPHVRSDKQIRLSAAYFLGIIIFCDFEMTMLTNTIAVAIPLWFTIGYGLMRANYLKQQKM
jgi:hypothetical protein